ncbi:MAG: zinc ABC transporter substrate-binding protein [Desulfobacteraceae bacterium]
MNRLYVILTLNFSILLFIFGDGVAADKLPVFVTITPQQYFVQQIGKDLVDVQVLVEPGADPHTYEPKPQQMVAISKARLYFAVGIELEEAKLSKITATNPNLKVIHTDHGIEKLAMEAHHQHHDDHKEEHHENDHHEAEHDHKHDHKKDEHHGQAADEHHGQGEHHEGHHEHAGLDPHIWLSPPLVKIQARSILAALQEADPAHGSVYEANFKAFATRIDQLDADLKKTFSGKTGMQFLVFHPAWGYFAHAYGLKQVPIEIEGKNPKPAQLKELLEHAKENHIKVVFVQPQFSTKSAELIAKEIGGQVAFTDPLAENWMANLRQVADKFKAALK